MADLVIFFLDLVTVTTPRDVISRIKLVKINFTSFKMISVPGSGERGRGGGLVTVGIYNFQMMDDNCQVVFGQFGLLLGQTAMYILNSLLAAVSRRQIDFCFSHLVLISTIQVPTVKL